MPTTQERSLKQTLVTVGLVCSILTAIVGSGKEIAGVAKDWLVSDNKAVIEQLRTDVDTLSKKFDEKDLKQQKANLSLKQQIFELKVAMAYGATGPTTKSIPMPLMSMVTPETTKTEVVEATTKAEVIIHPVIATVAKPSMKIGWIIGIIGLISGVIFGILHLTHKKDVVKL